MHCPACGNMLSPDARFCTRCGTASAAQQPLYRDRVARHLSSLAALWLVYAVLRALKGAIGLAFLHGIFGGRSFGGWTDTFPHAWMWGLWPIAGVALGIGVLGALLTGFALMTRQPWGRVVAIVFGVLALLHPLLGTALGIYTLWVLAPGASGDAYEREAALHRTN